MITETAVPAPIAPELTRPSGRDPHELAGKADYVIANPPFNVAEIDADTIKRDPRLPFGLPGVNKAGKVSNGNYVWISYFYSYLSAKGRAGFVMSSQASSAGNAEAKVRQKLVEAKVKGPGVVTGRSGSLGAVMFVHGDFWPLNTTLWVKVFRCVGPLFATYLLEAMHLGQYNGGAAVPTLNRNDVHRVEVLRPPSMLLQLFEQYAGDFVGQMALLRKCNAQVERARDLLLPRLMSGDLAV